MTSLQKPPAPSSSAVDTFTKPVAAETMFAQPPPGSSSTSSSTPTKPAAAAAAATEATVAEPAAPTEDSVAGNDDDEGEMDEVPLTPGQNEEGAVDNATGMPLPPPLAQN